MTCPFCSRESTSGGRFCPWCAAPLGATSAETAVMVAAAPRTPAPSRPSSSSSVTLDEGRFLPGTVLAGRYRIAGLLGRGGMGEVYRATDLTLGLAVALKFLPEAASRDDRARARFYNEVRMARQVTHPNVCRVYDIGEVAGEHYISMEFVDGEDLVRLLRRIGRLPADKATDIARKMCAGLAAAHEKGVLHRDLKPANVMIDGRGQVILMDFGLAGLTDQLQADARSGTPAYMSPEQLAGTEVTVKSDIYALGLVLYELFTGKRAFEASSLMELIEMQQRSAPASMTSAAKDLDPTVERIILCCLAPDPRQRPASALAVAAGLPGGDPLAAALAAGETPSPELVAAAGETEGMRPAVALGWLAAAVVGLVAATILSARLSITAKVPLELSPEALARDARTLLKGFGYTAKPADSAWGLEVAPQYGEWLKQHPDRLAERWKNPAAGFPPLIQFWYRESPRDLLAHRHFNTTVNFMDPPLDVSGMLRLKIDPEGKLLQLEGVPLQVEPPVQQITRFDWSVLFRAAGLDSARFHSAEPQWTPLANWDSRAAWTGTDPRTNDPLRVEAAAWRGRPVFFRIFGPWSKPERMESSGAAPGQLAYLAIVYGAFVAAGAIAWYNVRLGRSDRQGAYYLALLYFVSSAAARFLEARHSPTIEELDVFWLVVAVSAINAFVAWLFYLALEPWVRRRWPHTLIGWSRYTTKGIHDPLVGRDLLLGTLFGVVLGLGSLAVLLLHGPGSEPLIPALSALLGVRWTAAIILDAFQGSLFTTLFYFFILFIARVLFRKQWAAALALMVVVAVINSIGTSHPWVDWPVNLLYGAVIAAILLRYGLLALIVAHGIFQILLAIPRTLDLSSWYAALGWMPGVLAAAVAIYGFRKSLAGRPLLREDLL